MPKKKLTDETAFMQSKNEPIFALVKKENKVNICVANYKVSSKEFKNFKEAEEYISAKPYELIINTACLFVELNKKENKNENEKV